MTKQDSIHESTKNSNIPTPHINAKQDDFGKTVIMPGDPLRSKMIAETFLTDAKLVNNIRGIQGYTGYYKGKKVSVMASGMGNPTMGIYSYELFKFYDVDNIIRVGSSGAFLPSVNINDVIIANQVYTDTNYYGFYKKHGEGFINASAHLVDKATQTANKLGLHTHVGAMLCSETFYGDSEQQLAQEKQLLAVEMEGAALYINAERTGKNALVICTVSDSFVTGEKLTSEQRQNAFSKMIELALEMAE